MAEIDGGALSFKSVLDNDQLNAAIDETLRRVQGFSDAVVGSGDVMDKTTQEMVECIEIQRKVVQDLENSYNDLTSKINAIEPGDAQNKLIEQADSLKQELDAERQGLVALMNEFSNLQETTSGAAMSLEQIRAALGQIGDSCAEQEQEITRLETQYKQLSTQMDDAFRSGRDDEYRAINDRMSALKGEITVRTQLLNELRDQSNALENEAGKIEKASSAAKESAQSHVSFRTRLREVREELMQMELAGDTGSAKYKELQARMGALSEAMDAVTTQQNMLKRGERMWDGLLSGLSGVSGAFSAAQGAVALFSGENENLQKIMLKVQSLMAVTIGLKEVQLALDKDEAFRLVTINGLKEWWNKLLAIGRGEQAASTAATVADTAATAADTAATTANTAAQQANTAAQTGNTAAQGAHTAAQAKDTAAAVAGTAAHIGLAGALRMVGAAIKSIMPLGLIAAALGAAIAVISKFIGKTREAKKASEEFSKAVIDGCYKPIGNIELLSAKWKALGDNMEAKNKFIEENKAAFDELGVSVNGITDAENLLIANKGAFINAMMAKARAAIYTEQAMQATKELMEAQQKLEKAPKTYVTQKGTYTDGYGTERKGIVTVKNSKWQEAEDAVKAAQAKMDSLFEKARLEQANQFEAMNDANIDSVKQYEDGTIGALEQAIQDKQAKLKELKIGSKEFTDTQESIADLQRQLDKAQGKKDTTTKTSAGDTKDPFIEKLNKYKAEYQRFQKYVNSGDEVLVRSANQEFAGLLAEGATYIDYLKNQRDQILSVDVASRTKEQNQRLRQLNDSIAEETKSTVLDAFNDELNAQLSNARTVLDMLNVIEKMRKELSGDGSELDNEKQTILDDAQSRLQEQAKEQVKGLLSQYASSTDKQFAKIQQYYDNVELLESALAKATTEKDRQMIQSALDTYKKLYQLGLDNEDDLLALNEESLRRYGSYEDKRLAITREYEQRIAAAKASGLDDVAKRLEGERDLEILKETEEYKAIFSDLADMTITSAEKSRNAIVSMLNDLVRQGKITASQYRDMLDSIDSKMNSMFKGQVWQMLLGNKKGAGVMNFLFGEGDLASKIDSFRTIFSGAQNDLGAMVGDSAEIANNMNMSTQGAANAAGAANSAAQGAQGAAQGAIGAAQGAAGAISIVDAIIRAVYQTLRGISDILVTVGELYDSFGKSDKTDKLNEAAAVINSFNEPVMSGWENFKNGNAMGAIADTVKSIIGPIVTINKILDNRKDKIISDHAEAVEDLGNAYTQLSWEIDRALGGDYYQLQQKSIENLEQQKKEIQEMQRLEEEKKNTDESKVKDYQEQQAELNRQIQDIYDEMSQNILVGDVKSMADNLGSAIVDAFMQGEDAAEAWGETVDDIVNDIVKNLVIQKVIQEPLGNLISKYTERWFDDKGNFKGFDTVIGDIDNLGEELTDMYPDLQEALEALKEKLHLSADDNADDTSLSGAVKGITEETAGILEGYMNAIRMNQMESTQVLRQSLQALNTIANNTAYNRLLQDILSVVRNLQKPTGDSLRSQGLS